ncbi:MULTISPECIES: SGNH/GDSL hydrolase family protein [Anaerotignum]|uniref:SGNH/GDSL hydrolase family protein n=1 Tax=Anaerotignum TaxID=2039240 RepID=UPI00210A3FE5|nr:MULTISPECIES: GDSL-type esterase/lipase family protein [Anaerotignum]MCQ4935873.1 GDSL-type esterase/lipase family protein [Anaerotignum propionicum]
MDPFTIVAFGDSLTYGYGVLDHIAFPACLKKDFPKWRIINKGINGNTTREALERIHRDVLLFHPQIVLIFFGSNDSAMLEDYYRPLIEYEKNMRSITELVLSLQHGKEFNNGTPLPIFITPPPVVDTDFFPFTTTDRVKLYAESVQKIANEYNCPVIDFFSELWSKKEEAFDDFFQFDGIHLSNAGYALLYPMIRDVIANYYK